MISPDIFIAVTFYLYSESVISQGIINYICFRDEYMESENGVAPGHITATWGTARAIPQFSDLYLEAFTLHNPVFLNACQCWLLSHLFSPYLIALYNVKSLLPKIKLKTNSQPHFVQSRNTWLWTQWFPILAEVVLMEASRWWQK